MRFLEILFRGLALGELEALAGAWLTGLFPFLHPWVTGEETERFNELAVLRIDFRERAGDRVTDGDGLTVDAAAFDDDLEVELVNGSNVLERSENGVLKLNGRKIFFERAIVDDDLAGAFGKPDVSHGGFATAGGALSGNSGHERVVLELLNFVNSRVLGFVRVGLTCINLELAVLLAAEAGLRDHAPDRVLHHEDGLALADLGWSFDFLTTNVTGETGVDLRGFLGAGEDNFVRIDDDNEIAGINVGGENWFVFTAKQACSLNGDLAQDLALGVDHIPLALDFVRLGGKRIHVLKIGNTQRGSARGRAN